MVPGEDVSHAPPPVYVEKVLPLLTPLEQVLRSQTSAKQTETDGVTLLDEEVHFIDEQGRQCIAFHRVSKAFNDGGAKSIAESTWSYRRANQKIHLALARTILGDGKQIPVLPNAAILQTPQRQADYSLYDDQGELRLIFPSVKPDAITESIVVIDESQFRIPGEFTAANGLAAGWPIDMAHYILEMPASLAKRLKVTTVGDGVPEPRREQPSKDRVRLTWDSEKVPALPAESNSPPTRQVGPAFWLTTLPDWDAFVHWYEPLVEDHSALKPALAKQIDEWTQSATNPAKVLDILMAKVATDVRYVGLEFGAADLQPHDCNTVWENQYGDCKDKANLLRTMLRHKGINASLALVNTDDVGRIQRSSPDYRQFTHAIVAVELEPGHYLFCDPTIPYAKPGLLGPNDADRDILLVKSTGAEWTHTPAQDAGTVAYDFDLKLGADGEISGWLTQEMTGYYGVWLADECSRLDKDGIRERAHSMVTDFFKGAQLVDATKAPMEKWDGGLYYLKSYFIVPAVANQDDQGKRNLAFPQANSLFADLGAKKTRKTAYYSWGDTTKVTARIMLPKEFAPANLPAAYTLASPPVDISARWSVNGQECQAALQLHVKKNLIPPDQFEIFYNSLLSIRAWLETPLALSGSGTQQDGTQENAVTLDNFPMMTSGEGQLELVDQRFPEDGDSTLRREAFQQTIKYFPYDKYTLFTAGVKLAMMNNCAAKSRETADEIRRLLQTYRGSLSVGDAAWGEYLVACCLMDCGHSDEAEKMFARLGADKGLTAFRRSWSDYERARILEPKSRSRAIEALRQALTFDAEAKPASFTLLAKLLILDGRIGDLKAEINHMVAEKPPQFAAMLSQLAESAGDLLPVAKAAQRDALIQILEEAGKSADLGKRFDDGLRASEGSIRTNIAAARIRGSLIKYLAKNPPSKLGKTENDFKSAADFARAIEGPGKNPKPDLCVRYRLEQLTRFEPGADFPSILWKAADNADWTERYYQRLEPLLPVLLDLCDQLPEENDYFFEGRFLRADGCVRHGDSEAAQKIHEQLLADPKLPDGFKASAIACLGDDLERRRDYRKALEVYRSLEPQIQNTRAKDHLLRAVFLNLELGNRDEAFRLLSILRERTPEAIKEASTGWQITEMLSLTKEKQTGEAYWDGSAKWWPAWLAIEQKVGMRPQGDEQIVPAFPDPAGFNDELQAAARTRDREAYFQKLRRLAHAARWEPLPATDLAQWCALNAPAVVPEAADDLRRFAVTLSDNFATSDPELLRKMQFFATAACVDSDQHAKAIQIIHAFEKQPQADDGISEAMARLWGVAAEQEKSEIEPAITTLEKTLALPAKRTERGRTVLVLADLYRKAGRGSDEENLLNREVENPDIKASPSDLQSVKTRYDEVAKTGSLNKKFSQAVESWLQKKKPAWFDFAEPKTLDDPQLSNLEEVLKTPENTFQPAEIVKLLLLVASSPAQPYDRREEAFVNGLGWLSDFSQTKEEARAILEPIIDDNQFSEWVRTEALWRAILSARFDDDAVHFEKLYSHPLAKGLSDRSKASCEIYREALSVDQSSPDAVSSFCGRLLDKEVTGTALQEFRSFYKKLLDLNQTDAGEVLYKRLSDIKLNPETQTTNAALQMECLKLLNHTRKWAPAVDAMRQLVLAEFPAETIHEPPAYKAMHGTLFLGSCDEELAAQIRLYQLKTRRCDLTEVHFWSDLIRSIGPSEAHQKLAIKLFAAGFEKIPDDTARASLILSVDSAIDTDNPKLRGAVMELVKPYRNAEQFRSSYDTIRMLEQRWAWRSGQPMDPESDLSSSHSVITSTFVDQMKLDYYMQSQNVPMLRKTLESLSPDDLLSERLLVDSLRAFDLAGMTDESALARDTATKALYRALLQSWSTLDSFDIFQAYLLANALHDPSRIPRNWYSDLSGRLSHRRHNLYLRAEDAALREDWPSLLSAANEAIPLFPTFYHLYWYKGAALYHQGKIKEAAGPLRTYVQYSKNEAEYTQAKEWLDRIPAK